MNFNRINRSEQILCLLGKIYWKEIKYKNREIEDDVEKIIKKRIENYKKIFLIKDKIEKCNEEKKIKK